MNRIEFEAALDSGRVKVIMRHGNPQTARRSGATKLWKTRPNDWSVPIKHGFRGTARIDHDTSADALMITPEVK